MNVLVIDDHPLVQQAISLVLRHADPGASIRIAGTLEEGLALATAAPPDLALLDLALPRLAGLDALDTWRRRFPDVRVVILSAAADGATISRALACGASGFIPKGSSADIVEHALRLVIAGGRYVPPEVLAEHASTAVPAHAAPGVAGAGLTARQLDVLRLLASGESNKGIARTLEMAERTVKDHVTAIFRALHVTSRSQAAVEAVRRGLGQS